MYSRKSILLLFCAVLMVSILFSFKNENETTPYKFPELKGFPEAPFSENVPTIEGVSLGRFLFYDSILSANYTFSCASCHKQEVAFSDSPKQFSKGINGMSLSRNTMPLFNLAWYPSMFWDGRSSSIEDQVFHPLRAHNEMNLDWKVAVERIEESTFYKPKIRAAFGTRKIDSFLIADAIAQFERTLISNNSKYDLVLQGKAYFTKDEFEGFELMNDQTKGDCLHCHTTDADALGTIAQFSNNGLDATLTPDDYIDKGKAQVTNQDKDVGQFKIPSLRNVAVTAPYMHDGRFNSLEEVLDFYSEEVNNSYNIDSKMQFAHQKGVRLTSEEKRKIISFLHTMTDSTFLTNPAYSNPFVK